MVRAVYVCELIKPLHYNPKKPKSLCCETHTRLAPGARRLLSQTMVHHHISSGDFPTSSCLQDIALNSNPGHLMLSGRKCTFMPQTTEVGGEGLGSSFLSCGQRDNLTDSVTHPPNRPKTLSSWECGIVATIIVGLIFSEVLEDRWQHWLRHGVYFIFFWLVSQGPERTLSIFFIRANGSHPSSCRPVRHASHFLLLPVFPP